jgi:hypothetical protein
VNVNGVSAGLRLRRVPRVRLTRGVVEAFQSCSAVGPADRLEGAARATCSWTGSSQVRRPGPGPGTLNSTATVNDYYNNMHMLLVLGPSTQPPIDERTKRTDQMAATMEWWFISCEQLVAHRTI